MQNKRNFYNIKINDLYNEEHRRDKEQNQKEGKVNYEGHMKNKENREYQKIQSEKIPLQKNENIPNKTEIHYNVKRIKEFIRHQDRMNKMSTKLPAENEGINHINLENRGPQLANNNGKSIKHKRGQDFIIDKQTEMRPHRRVPEVENSQEMNMSIERAQATGKYHKKFPHQKSDRRSPNIYMNIANNTEDDCTKYITNKNRKRISRQNINKNNIQKTRNDKDQSYLKIHRREINNNVNLPDKNSRFDRKWSINRENNHHNNQISKDLTLGSRDHYM